MGFLSLSAAQGFASIQFSGARLGDLRRSRRLIKVAAALAQSPRGTLHGALPNHAELTAAYRLLRARRATLDSVTQPHRRNVFQACGEAREVLLIEDTTTLNYNGLQHTQGLGWIGDDENTKGLYLHTTLALSVEGWNERLEPEVALLGLFAVHAWARTSAKRGQNSERKFKRLSRARESQRWAAALSEREGPPPGTRWTYMADRESDVFEVFQKCRNKRVDYIIRASQERALADEGRSVFEAVSQAHCMGAYTFKLRARPGQKRRRAKLQVRAVSVTLRGPQRPGGRLEPMPMNVVEVREVCAPTDADQIRWVLLTTWPISNLNDVLRVVRSYSKRWLIEEFHKALKTGMRVEESQLMNAQSLQTLVGILAVLALRMLNLKMSSRLPDKPLNPGEMDPDALMLLEKNGRKPSTGWTYQTVVYAIAKLGGYLARKHDGPPGWQILWRGWHRLMTMVEGIQMLRSA
jgi:hypothetical protein